MLHEKKINYFNCFLAFNMLSAQGFLNKSEVALIDKILFAAALQKNVHGCYQLQIRY
jgi:hypothetical protein